MAIAFSKVPKTTAVLWLNGKHYRMKQITPLHESFTKSSDITIDIDYPDRRRHMLENLSSSYALCTPITLPKYDRSILTITVNNEILFDGEAKLSITSGRKLPEVTHYIVQPSTTSR